MQRLNPPKYDNPQAQELFDLKQKLVKECKDMWTITKWLTNEQETKQAKYKFLTQVFVHYEKSDRASLQASVGYAKEKDPVGYDKAIAGWTGSRVHDLLQEIEKEGQEDKFTISQPQ